NAHRLLRLVDDMLDLARLEAGYLDLALHPVEVELCIKEAIAIVEMQSPSQPFSVAIDVPRHFPFVQADAMWLRRTLAHLLMHLLNSSTTRQISIRAYDTDSQGTGARQLQIDVQDAGLVLSAAEQASIFEAFQHVPNSESDLTIRSLSRLGLAIGKRAIDQMRGQLSLCSELGQGSTFTIRLQAAELAIEHAARP